MQHGNLMGGVIQLAFYSNLNWGASVGLCRNRLIMPDPVVFFKPFIFFI